MVLRSLQISVEQLSACTLSPLHTAAFACPPPPQPFLRLTHVSPSDFMVLPHLCFAWLLLHTFAYRRAPVVTVGDQHSRLQRAGAVVST